MASGGGGGGGRGRNRRIQQSKLGPRQYLLAARDIAKLTWETTPGTIVIQIAGAIITAVLPIVTTYFAALTTTALGEAFAGDETAGGRAITYVVITAALGLLLTGWRSLEQYVQRLMRYALEAKVSDIMYERFLSLEFWRYDDKDTIDTYDRAQRFSQFYAMAFNSLSRMASQLITLLASVIALLLVGWWLAVILLVAIVPGVYLQFRLSREQIKHWNSTVDTRRAKGTIERQLFQPEHIAELRLYGMVRHLLNLRQQLRDADEKQRIEFERSYILKRLAADGLEVAGRGRLAAVGDVPDHRPPAADRAVPLRAADRLEGAQRDELVRHRAQQPRRATREPLRLPGVHGAQRAPGRRHRAGRSARAHPRSTRSASAIRAPTWMC